MNFSLLYGGAKRRLSAGDFLLGRSPDCAVVLEDPLVSRHHAVLRVRDSSVQIEDLGSRNGVCVNGQLIAEATELVDGDSIKILEHHLQISLESGSSGFSTTARFAATRPTQMFGVLGALADKALALGQGAEAQRILGTHLDNLVSEMNEGRVLEEPVVTVALRYAAKLGTVTRRGHWFSYVFKLLVAKRLSCPGDVLDELYSGAALVETTDLREIREYIHLHQEKIEAMSPPERFVLSRVQGLERLLSA